MQKPQFGMPLVIVLAAGLFLVGCKAPENSSDLVLTASDSALASILHDLHKADAVAFETSVDKGPQVVSAVARDSVLSAHSMTEETFTAAIDARVLDPSRLLAIYNLTLDLASRN